MLCLSHLNYLVLDVHFEWKEKIDPCCLLEKNIPLKLL